MVQHKAQLKKQQKRGVDFKKIKRKIGRKLPPPKNTTNTEVKSKAIVLPEQSLASEKAGLAVSKKGLTLKELLQQTSHHNAKVRRDALIGIRDILLKHPSELKMHRLSVIEKLRERMSDEDKVVRETLYQLLKAVIFPGCKEENQRTFVSLMMAYVFNAMTHLQIDIRLMAFKFFDLVVQHYPLSFSMYAEKIIQHYKEILQKNQFNLHDKGKLKSAFAGLACCLSLLPSNDNPSTENVVADPRLLHAYESEVHEDHSVTVEALKDLLPILVGGLQDFMPSVRNLEAHSFDCVLSILKSIDLVVKFFGYWNDRSGQLKVLSPSNRGDLDVLQMLLKKLFDVFPLTLSSGKDDNKYFVFNATVSKIFFCLSDRSAPPPEKFLVFIVDALSEKVCSPGKTIFEKHSLPLIPFIPKLIMQVDDTWKAYILQAFTDVFNKCDPETSMKLVCLSAVEEMIFPENIWPPPKTSEEIVDFWITWIREIPLLLITLGDKNPSSSKAVVRFLLRLGQHKTRSPRIVQEYNNMQYLFREFFSTCRDGGNISYGPFRKLSKEIQKLSVCCVAYFSFLDASLLQSIAACCSCRDLEPGILNFFFEVVNSAFEDEHIKIADYISFLITLPTLYGLVPESGVESSPGKLKSIVDSVCSDLSKMENDGFVFKMIEGVLIDQILNKLPLENTCALLRIISRFDSHPTRLSEQSISKLGNVIPGYLIDSLGEEDHRSSNTSRRKRYYNYLPCFYLFDRSDKILNDVLTSFISSDGQTNFDHSNGVVRVLLLMLEDPRMCQILSLYKEQIDSILHNILRLHEGNNLSIGEKHKLQCTCDQIRSVVGQAL